MTNQNSPTCTQSQLFFWIALAIIVIFHAFSFNIYPAPFVDEAWMLARTWSFKQNGIVFGTFDAGVFDRLPGYQHFFPWIPNFFWYLVVFFQHTPELYAVRIVSLVFGAVLLSCTYSISKSLSNANTAMISVLLLAFSIPFCFSAHIVRFDIIAATLGYAALAYQLSNKNLNFIPSFIAGLLLGLACEAHLHAAVLIAPFCVLPFLTPLAISTKLRSLSGQAAGLMIGLVIYISLHMLPNPQEYFALQKVAFAPTHLPPLISGSFAIIIDALLSMQDVFANAYVLWWIVLPLSAFILAVDTQGKKTLLLSIITTLSFALFIRSKMLSYYILLEPMLALMIAQAISIAYRKKSFVSPLFKALPFILITLCILNTLRTINQIDPQERIAFEQHNQNLSQYIKADDVIMGPQTHWFKFFINKFYSWENLVFYLRYSPTSSLEDAFLQFKPNIFIAGPPFTQYLNDELPGPSTFLHVSKKQFDAVMDKYSVERITIPADAHYARIDIYRFDWRK